MTEWDLDQAATALWIPIAELPLNQIAGGQSKIFDELRGAVLFVMDELPPEDRGAAMIQTDQGWFRLKKSRNYTRKLSPNQQSVYYMQNLMPMTLGNMRANGVRTLARGVWVGAAITTSFCV
jgi:hypothetical protein